MSSVLELTKLLKNGVGGDFHPLFFPAESEDSGSQVEITSGGQVVGGKGDMNVQIITRDVHPAYAESKSLEIRSFLNDGTGFSLGELQIILVKAESLFPFYLGTDDNGRHLFSENYKFIMGVL